MNLVSLTFIGIGLSIDSLAASITTGACSRNIKIKQVFKVALFMAIFQGTMPLLGWIVGISFKEIIESYDHWIAFILLFGIGAKLIYDGISNKEESKKNSNPTSNLLLAGIALATSIDAMIIGIGFGLIEVNILHAMIVIGSMTFLFSIIGVYVGEQVGTKINKGIEIFGGLLLIGLGLKILIEHIYL